MALNGLDFTEEFVGALLGVVESRVHFIDVGFGLLGRRRQVVEPADDADFAARFLLGPDVGQARRVVPDEP